MRLSKSSITLALDLIEDRISQLDAFVPRDADDLQRFLRCREEFKVAAHATGSPDGRTNTDFAWHRAKPARRKTAPRRVPAAALDVI